MRIAAAVINDTSGRGHFGCDLVMASLRDGLAGAGIDCAWSHPVGRDWRPTGSEWMARPSVDVVIVNGEGSIHHSQDRDRARYLPAVAPFVRRHMGARAYLLNATIADIDGEVADDLRCFDAIYVRDSGSQKGLLTYGIQAKTVPDLTISAHLPGAVERKGVCATDSVLPDCADALKFAAAENGWPVRTMVVRGKPRRPWKRQPDYRDFAAFLSSHELVVTGRYHTVTFCLATRTPFVAIESNTPKISWLLDDVFASRRRIVSPSQLRDLNAGDFDAWTTTEEAAIDLFLTTARASTASMFSDIASGIIQI